ncbi:MAG: septal ring lytic transglycosylase RlpA family protein [Pseudolabrys sp.]|nr:septal ring lytic transglycosylase RlpA family protein [Pseudolabrys sp.]
MLAACAQPAVVDQPSLRAASRPMPIGGAKTEPATSHRVAAIAHARSRRAEETPRTSYGMASFYAEGQKTANGERFDPNDLTAAHPTLPFGTRLRVTNLATGRSVTVRVNDRGPFVPGRIVDVSYSAAASLGMVGQGVAKVKLQIVQ